MNKGKFIVVSGPSGVGKGTICDVLIKELDAWYSVSMTTREMREGEEEGKNYYFVTKEEFENKIKEGNFIEYNIYNNNYYGTPKDKILEKINEGVDVFLEIDVNGARNIKKQFPDSLLIYIAPPSIEELRKRLENRGTETEEKIQNRLKIAEEELKQTNMYDYVIINDDLQKAIDEVRQIIKEN